VRVPRGRRPKLILLASVVIVLVWSAVQPRDRFTWWLEAAPVLLGIPLVLATAARFPLTPLASVLLAVHALILLVGAHYTYAEVPAGFTVQAALGLARNHYDRLGHFAQGFVPAIVAREVLARRVPVPAGWQAFFVFCICLTVSALYELIEWWAAVLTGEAATAFLGTQGDPWDTQWDMMLAGLGALTALASLGGIHDRQLAALRPAVAA
jgi:putative membrane protein